MISLARLCTSEVSALSEHYQKKEAELQKFSNTHEQKIDTMETGIVGAVNEKAELLKKLKSIGD